MDVDSAQLPVERMLGIWWNPDVFQFQCDLQEIATSRQTMLSMVSSIYDPLGFIAPLLILNGISTRDVHTKTGWDDQPDTDILIKWEQWVM